MLPVPAVAVGEALARALAVAVAVADALAATVGSTVAVVVGEALGDTDAGGLVDADALGDADADALGDADVDALGDADVDALGDADEEALGDADGLGDGFTPHCDRSVVACTPLSSKKWPLRTELALTVMRCGLPGASRQSVIMPLGCDGEGDALVLGDADALGDGEALALADGEPVGDAVMLGDAEALGDVTVVATALVGTNTTRAVVRTSARTEPTAVRDMVPPNRCGLIARDRRMHAHDRYRTVRNAHFGDRTTN